MIMYYYYYIAIAIVLLIIFRTRVKTVYLNVAINAPVYLISLPKDTDRRHAFFGLATPDTVHSVNGANIDKDEKIESGTIKNKEMTRGEYGCYLSHVEIIEMISKDVDNDISVVFEDDATFSTDRINEVIEELEDADFEWDLIFLGHNYTVEEDGEVYKFENGDTFNRINYLHGAQGYLVNNKNAYKYKNLLPISEPYDVAVCKIMKCYKIEPKVVELNNFGGRSSTQGIR